MDYNPKSLADIDDQKLETEQKGLMEVDDLKKLVVEKAEGIRIFEIIKNGLLRETFEILEDEEGGLSRLSDELGDERNTKLEGYDREFNTLAQELTDQQDRMQTGREKLEGVMQGFHQELKDLIVGTCNQIDQKQQETADVQDDLEYRQTQLANMKTELTQIMKSVTPENIGRYLQQMKRGQSG